MQCRPDTSWEREDKDLYAPDFVDGYLFSPVLFVRISKAGKCIGRKFAGRYYDAVNYGILLHAILSGGKGTGFPPAEMTPSFTASAILSRYMCPGMISLCAQMIPMMGFFISLSVQPSARMSERCEDIAVPSEKMLFMIISPLLRAVAPF